MINVYASNRGWLFEDLKRRYDAIESVVVTSKPITGDVEAWICIRTKEAERTPDPSRTVVQIHDLFSRERDAAHIDPCAGLVLTHPDQAAALKAHGVELDDKIKLLRPIGAAASCYGPKRAPQAAFSVGWCGRPAMWRGRDIKGLEFLDKTLRELGKVQAFRFHCWGQQLEKITRRLKNADGVYSAAWPRESSRWADFDQTAPRFYGRLDVLLITSEVEAGPLPLFEALAAGVPVVTRRCGWAEQMIHDGVNGYVVDSELQAVTRLLELAKDKGERVRSMAAQVPQPYRLEDWLRETVLLAQTVARREAA